MNTKTVGQRIAQARSARGMSQGELAKLAGFKTQSGIGNLENRKDGRGGFSLAKIAAALSVPVEWLLDGPDGDTVPSAVESNHSTPQRSSKGVVPYTDHDRAEAIIRKLPPKAIKEALQFLEYLAAKYNAPSVDGADHPVPAPQSKAA